MPAPALPDANASGLRMDGIAYAYGREAVLDGVALDLPRGEIGVVIGPSGCGKSTLLAIVGGLAAPSAGRITRPFDRPAFMFQEPCLLPWRTARDNIAFGMKTLGFGRAERCVRAAQLVAAVGLTREDGDKYPHALSGGMKSRVALARALAVEPDLLLLDEPFAALDFGRRRHLEALLARLIDARGLTALMVTHDIAEAVRLADRVFVMSAKPARIVATHAIACPRRDRDDGFVLGEASRMLARPQIADALAVADEP